MTFDLTASAVTFIYVCLSLGPLVPPVSCLLPTLAPAPNVFSSTPNPTRKPPPETFMTTPEIIRYHGYPVEEHHVTTADGYILTMFRIPHGKNNTKVTKIPVFIQHGIMASSDDWLILDPSSNLPYLLAEDGHDVWIGNSRGNNYSVTHTTLDQSDLKFWNFSFHEMGVYDIPVCINYVLNTTGHEQISYVGHSLGCAVFFIAMERYPELQTKIHRMIAMAPAAYVNHMISPVFRSFAYVPSPALKAFFDVASGGRILPSAVNKWLHEYAGQICVADIPTYLCQNFIFLISGFDPDQTTNDLQSKIYGHLPSSCSVRTFDHSLQMVRRGKFQEYGGLDQPLYNLTAVRVPTYVMYGDNDWLIQPVDVKRTVSELGNVVKSIRINFKKFGHLDFTYAKDAKKLVYDQCISILK